MKRTFQESESPPRDVTGEKVVEVGVIAEHVVYKGAKCCGCVVMGREFNTC